MNREEEKKSPSENQLNQQQTAGVTSSKNRKEDDDQRSYPGKLDAVEGSMNNGELGGGLSKENGENS